MPKLHFWAKNVLKLLYPENSAGFKAKKYCTLILSKLACNYGGEGGIRTLEPLLTVTRFPIVRARPGYATSPRIRSFEQRDYDSRFRRLCQERAEIFSRKRRRAPRPPPAAADNLRRRAKKPLYKSRTMRYNIVREASRAPVAQLDRVSDSDSEGRKFESCRAYRAAADPSSAAVFSFPLRGAAPAPPPPNAGRAGFARQSPPVFSFARSAPRRPLSRRRCTGRSAPSRI